LGAALKAALFGSHVLADKSEKPVYRDPQVYALIASGTSDNNVIRTLPENLRAAYEKFMQKGYSEGDLFPTEDRSIIETESTYEWLVRNGVNPENIQVLFADGDPDYSALPDSSKLVGRVKPATKGNIKKAIQNMKAQTDGDDTLLFYGLSENSSGAAGFSAWDSTLTQDELNNLFDDDARQVLYFDQCYPAFAGIADENTAIITSTSPGTRALSDRNHSFGRFFTGALNGSVNIEDAYETALASFNDWQNEQSENSLRITTESEPQIRGPQSILDSPLFEERGYSAFDLEQLRTNYSEFLRYLEFHQAQLSRMYETDRKRATEEARDFIYHTINDVLMPAWLGTDWNFYGITRQPRNGEIACGHYVARILRDAGFDVDDSSTRTGLGVQLSGNIAKSVCPPGNIKWYSNRSIAEIEGDLVKNGDSVFIMGHACGAGFFVTRDGQAYVCNSTHHFLEGEPRVVYVPIEESPDVSGSLSSRKAIVVGNVLNDETIEKWLRGEKIETVR
jgi:hypothetical protein